MRQVVHMQNISKSYGDLVVLSDLNLDIEEGSIFGLVGSNGAGKTTTIKILLNIIKATAGYAEIIGIDSRRLMAKDFTKIGYVSENQEMPSWMTIDYLFRYLKFFYPTWDEQRTTNFLDKFELPGDRQLRNLSRGMWMKVALISSLAFHPNILIMDEPFSGLDPSSREDLVNGILRGAQGTTVLISSHDLADLEDVVTHIGFLNGARLQFSESIEKLRARFKEIVIDCNSWPHERVKYSWPDNWSKPDISDNRICFVDAQFEEEHSITQIRHIVGGLCNITIKQMNLRAIFAAIMRRS